MRNAPLWLLLTATMACTTPTAPTQPQRANEIESPGAVEAKVPDDQSNDAPTKAPPAPSKPPLEPQLAADDALVAKGEALFVEFECNRCHGGHQKIPPASRNHSCVRCHVDIGAGRAFSPAERDALKRNVQFSLKHVPSLLAVDQRLRRDWLEQFLLSPHKLRPMLSASMPRLNLTTDEAKALAAYLSPQAASPAPNAFKGDSKRGQALMDEHGCGFCHRFTAGPSIAAKAPQPPPKDIEAAMLLAPDLRWTRDRWRRDRLVAWLVDPAKLKHDTAMPGFELTPTDAQDIAALILTAPLGPLPKAPLPSRLALLERRVTYEEVATRVLRQTCRHCHSAPDTAAGDGGPGNTGGFGFAGRGLNLDGYSAVASGMVDDSGQRRSVFTPLTPGGPPYIIEALMARHAEEAGQPVPGIRGMPLGLAPLPLEDIQLLETWIAQGRPR